MFQIYQDSVLESLLFLNKYLIATNQKVCTKKKNTTATGLAVVSIADVCSV